MQADDRSALAVRLFRTMATIRRTELRIEDLHRAARISGSFHSSIGQEGCAAGVGLALRPDDVMTSTHRGHGHAIAKGVPLESIFAELFERRSGASSARGGSMHLHYRAAGFLGESAIVGGAMAWLAGAAWARRRLGGDSVGVSFVGDGAFSQGAFHETLRLSQLWQSPALFVCENNGFAHSMPVERAIGKPGAIADFVRAEGLRSEFVDGRDALDVYDATCELLATVRAGQPAFLECEVFRVKPHSLSDPDYLYRPKEAGRDWLAEHDPLILMRAHLGRHDEEIDGILSEVRAEVDEAVRLAEQSRRPDPKEARVHLYATKELEDRA